MQWSRVKTLLICLLLAVDLFLLSNMGMHVYRQRQQQRQLWDNTLQVLESRGISLAQGMSLPQSASLEWYSVSRSHKREERVSQALLGQCERVSTDQGEEYRGENGFLVWQADGYVSGLVQGATQQTATSPEQAEQIARELLQGSGIQLNECEWSAVAQKENYLVTLRHTGGAQPVFNEQMQILLKIDLSADISGRWCLGEATLSGWETVADYSPADVLLTAMADWSGLEIQKMEYGYVLSIDTSGRLCLNPTWRIATRSREIWMDAAKNTAVLEE